MELTIPYNSDMVNTITYFISSKVREAGANGVVIGLSGGVDSSLVAKLCTIALNKKKIHGLIMSEGKIDKKDTNDAIQFAREQGIKWRVIYIKDIIRVMNEHTNRLDIKSKGNLKARIRMLLLYAEANAKNLLVMGTGNKSEILTGYFTKYGDGGVDYIPIGDLYKTQVYMMAEELNIPENIIKKIPTAGLWRGQTDENELGISYFKLDRILLGIELRMSEEDIAIATSVDKKEVERIKKMIEKSRHKRRLPLVAKTGIRTPTIDWRE